MKKVYKYALGDDNNPIADGFAVLLPVGAQILAVQAQYDLPMLWALVDPAAALEKRTFQIFGTGHEIHDIPNNTRQYLGTFQLMGALVFHVFEVIPNSAP